MSENIMDGLRSEISRVKEIIKEYEHPDMNGAGSIAGFLMKGSISRAESALGDMDVANMVLCYRDLKTYEL